MPRSDKAGAVAELTEEFRSSSAAVLTEYRGLTVSELKELRRSLGSDTSYAVVKNTLTKIAAQDAGVSAFDDLLQGPSAIAFVKGDPVEAAKGLRDFARTHPLLVIKGGVMEGRALSPDEIRRLADLESREVLLAKLAGAMQAKLSQAVYLFAAPLSQAARTIDALRQKAEQDPSVLGGGAGTPAAAAETAPAETAPADEAPVAEAPADDAADATTSTGETSIETDPGKTVAEATGAGSENSDTSATDTTPTDSSDDTTSTDSTEG